MGSYLTISHATADFAGPLADEAAEVYRARGIPAQARSRGEVERFFDGLDWSIRGLRWRTAGVPTRPATAPNAPPDARTSR
jgi:hypothetical protein